MSEYHCFVLPVVVGNRETNRTDLEIPDLIVTDDLLDGHLTFSLSLTWRNSEGTERTESIQTGLSRHSLGHLTSQVPRSYRSEFIPDTEKGSRFPSQGKGYRVFHKNGRTNGGGSTTPVRPYPLVPPPRVEVDTGHRFPIGNPSSLVSTGDTKRVRTGQVTGHRFLFRIGQSSSLTRRKVVGTYPKGRGGGR